MVLEINPNKVYTVAKKEFMDNVRNKWVLILSLIFMALTIVFSYFGGAASGGGVKFQGFGDTVAAMSSIAAIFLPIIAIMLGYGSVISERENGSMGVVMGCPVSRFDVIIGKFAGLGSVLMATILIGFGISGLIVGVMTSFDGGLEYILFMMLTFVFSMFFLGFSIFMSTIANKRSTAMAGGLAVFFSGAIAGIILIGMWVATGGDMGAMMEAAMTGGEIPTFPDWYWAGMYFSFMDIYPMGSMLLFSLTGFAGMIYEYPDFVTAASIFGWFILLTALTFVSSIVTFIKKDL